MDRSVSKDLWKVDLLKSVKTSDRIRDTKVDHERNNLNKILETKMSLAKGDKASELKKEIVALDNEFIREMFRQHLKIGSQLHRR